MSTRFDDEPPAAALWWDKFVNFAWRTDWTQVVLILGLSALGVLAIWSAGEFRQSGFWRSQIVFIAIGWVAYWVVASIDYREFLRHARRIYLAGVLLLLPVSACAFLKTDLGGFIRSINGSAALDGFRALFDPARRNSRRSRRSSSSPLCSPVPRSGPSGPAGAPSSRSGWPPRRRLS